MRRGSVAPGFGAWKTTTDDRSDCIDLYLPLASSFAGGRLAAGSLPSG
jgi:hypothetical protein